MILLYIIVSIVVLIVAIIGLMWIYSKFVPKDDTNIQVEKRTPLVLEKITEKEALLSTEFVIENPTREETIIMDVFARPYLPQEQFDRVIVSAHIERISERRNDSYFEASVLQEHSNWPLIMTLKFTSRYDESITKALADMVDMDVALYFDGILRKYVHTRKTFTTFTREEIKKAVGGAKNE
ncbi:MAG TPA: hypothetical protein IAB06_03060 [Candidatus Avacidaminococcus intestinavium]|uniref:Uncharacterized protein n=1 Tax=Candidatus Avacidaminococcus intestinavium TaxID=2840684 RepID=A0A9D1MPG1_9FIRM|nr:hypothetical protein [Candidatus Avacidaminococcus intestinavium]